MRCSLYFHFVSQQVTTTGFNFNFYTIPDLLAQKSKVYLRTVKDTGVTYRQVNILEPDLLLIISYLQISMHNVVQMTVIDAFQYLLHTVTAKMNANISSNVLLIKS